MNDRHRKERRTNRIMHAVSSVLVLVALVLWMLGYVPFPA